MKTIKYPDFSKPLDLTIADDIEHINFYSCGRKYTRELYSFIDNLDNINSGQSLYNYNKMITSMVKIR